MAASSVEGSSALVLLQFEAVRLMPDGSSRFSIRLSSMVVGSRLFVTSLFLFLSFALSLAVSALVPFRLLEANLSDLRIRHLSPRQAQDPRIVLITIDEESLQNLPYFSPVPRDFLADILETLAAKQARVIGLDILIDRPTETEKDARFEGVLDRLGNRVVLAHAGPGIQLTPASRDYHEAFLKGRRFGDVALLPDPLDGVVRYQRPRSPNGELSFPAAIAEELAASIPDQSLAIAWRRGPAPGVPPFRAFPARTLKLLPDDWIRGRVALVGSDYLYADRHRTPLTGGSDGTLTTGLEIHAHALAQLLAGTRLDEPGALRTTVMQLAAGLMGITVANVVGSPVVLFLLTVGIGVVYLVAALLLYSVAGWMLPILPPLTALAFASFLFTAVLRSRERQQRQLVRHAFEHYLAPPVVARLLRDPSQLTRAAERREISFLFTDIAGFTALVEQIPAERMAGLLNRYLDGVMSRVVEHGGLVDKIQGDAVAAMFGAPEPQDDHRRRAIRCALAIDGFAEAFRSECRAQGVPFGHTRIGVHSGIALVGNFGGSQRFDYTAHGDVVNTASRLEGANRFFGTRILASRETAEPTGMPARPIGELLLKGKSRPLEVVEPLPDAACWLPLYLAFYRALADGRKEEAAGLLPELAGIRPGDPVLDFYRRRLAQGIFDVRVELPGK